MALPWALSPLGTRHALDVDEVGRVSVCGRWRPAPADISFHAPIDLRSGWVRVRTKGLRRGRGQRRNRRNRIGLSMQRLLVGVTYSAHMVLP